MVNLLNVTYASEKQKIARILYACAAFGMISLSYMVLADCYQELSFVMMARILLLPLIPVVFWVTARRSSIPTLAAMLLYSVLLLPRMAQFGLNVYGNLLIVVLFALSHRIERLLKDAQIVACIFTIGGFVAFLWRTMAGMQLSFGLERTMDDVIQMLLSLVLTMSLFGWRIAYDEQSGDLGKDILKIVIGFVAVSIAAFAFLWCVKNTVESTPEYYYHDTNNDGELSFGEWWGYETPEGESHWYQSGTGNEQHLYR